MRLRNAAAAAVAAFALVASLPGSASAATGDFEYKYGPGLRAVLQDPPSGECIDLPEASDSEPAYAPFNLTTSTATVFLDFQCDGDTFYVMNPGKKLGDRLKLRSVIFS